MLHTRTAIEHRNATVAAILPAVAGIGDPFDDFGNLRNRLAAERAMDEVLAESFPASDPPSWNPGVARPDPVGHGGHVGRRAAPSDLVTGADIIDVSRPGRRERTFLEGLVSLAGAGGIALLVPVAILLVGLPVALAVRGLLETISWLFGVVIL
ncbi:MAG: hypothetical protein GEU82_17110 [Luteitalea sp.]|nr:hypothetical protein [Luteitalea sp.]